MIGQQTPTADEAFSFINRNYTRPETPCKLNSTTYVSCSLLATVDLDIRRPVVYLKPKRFAVFPGQGGITLSGPRTVPVRSGPESSRTFWYSKRPALFLCAASRDVSRSAPELDAALFPGALVSFCPPPRAKLFPLSNEYSTSHLPDARSHPATTQSPFHSRVLRFLTAPLPDGAA
jgi:hypothetical protein